MMRAFGSQILAITSGVMLLSGGAWAAPVCGQRAVSFVHVTQDSHELFAGVQDMSGDCSVLIGVDLVTGKPIWRTPGMMTSAVSAISRDGRRLAISYAGKPMAGSSTFAVFDTADGHLVTSLQSDRANGLMLTGGDAVAIAMSPDGKEVYAALRNGWLAAWDAETGKSLFTQDPPAGSGTASGTGEIDVSPDGQLIAWTRTKGVYLLALPSEGTGGRNTVATVRNRSTGHDLHAPRFSPDGKTLAVAQGSVPGSTLLFAIAYWRTLPAITGCAGQIAWTADSSALACQTKDTVQLVSVGSGHQVVQSLTRLALEAPLTPIATSSSMLLYTQHPPASGALQPIVLTAFGTPLKKTVPLQ